MSILTLIRVGDRAFGRQPRPPIRPGEYVVGTEIVYWLYDSLIRAYCQLDRGDLEILWTEHDREGTRQIIAADPGDERAIRAAICTWTDQPIWLEQVR